MKNKIFKILTIFYMFLFAVLSVQAAITSESNLYTKINGLKNIIQLDYVSLINKSDMIGNRLAGFNLASSQYKNSVMLALDKLSNIPSRINEIRASSELSDSDKQMQINNLFLEADTYLYNLDSQTMNYLFSLKNCMPTITYNRYVKKFQEFYNSQHLTESSILIQ